MVDSVGATPVQIADPDEAFRMLRRLIEDRVSDGKSTRSASLKPTLRELGFNQEALGFKSFRQFLHDAESQGHVRLVRAPIGPDVDVLPREVVVPSASRPSTQVRSDVWGAFVQWNSELLRFYDRQADRVVTTSSSEDSGDFQRAWEREPGRFVPIRPVSPEITMTWMRDFAEALPEGTIKTELQSTLGGSRPFRDFKDAVERLGLAGRWREVRHGHTRREIDGWVEANALGIDLSRWPPPRSADSHPPLRRMATSPSASTTTREQILRAIHRMSTAELLRVPIPAEYLIRDRDEPGRS